DRPTDAAGVATYRNDIKRAFQDGHGEVTAPFGFKESLQVIQRAGEAGVHYPGPVFEPYLDPERFELRRIDPDFPGENQALVDEGVGFIYGLDTVILDPLNRESILYYPAMPKQPDIRAAATTNYIDGYNQNV